MFKATLFGFHKTRGMPYCRMDKLLVSTENYSKIIHWLFEGYLKIIHRQ